MKRTLLIAALLAPISAYAGQYVNVKKAPGCSISNTNSQILAANYHLTTRANGNRPFWIEPNNLTRKSELLNVDNMLATSVTQAEGEAVLAEFDAVRSEVLADLSGASCVIVTAFSFENDPVFSGYNATIWNGPYPSGTGSVIRDIVGMSDLDANQGTPSPSNPSMMVAESYIGGGAFNNTPNSNFDASVLGGMIIFGDAAPNDPSKPVTEKNHMNKMMGAVQQITGINIYANSFFTLSSLEQGINNVSWLLPSGKVLPISMSMSFSMPSQQAEVIDIYKRAFDTGKFLPFMSMANDEDDWLSEDTSSKSEDTDKVIFVQAARRQCPTCELIPIGVCGPAVDLTIDFGTTFFLTMGPTDPAQNENYRSTSTATVMTAGSAAQLASEFPTLTNIELRNAMVNSTKVRNNRATKDPCFGWGAYNHADAKRYIQDNFWPGKPTTGWVQVWGAPGQANLPVDIDYFDYGPALRRAFSEQCVLNGGEIIHGANSWGADAPGYHCMKSGEFAVRGWTAEIVYSNPYTLPGVYPYRYSAYPNGIVQ